MDYTITCESGNYQSSEIPVPFDSERAKIRKCHIDGAPCWVCGATNFPLINFTPEYKGINICENCLLNAVAISYGQDTNISYKTGNYSDE